MLVYGDAERTECVDTKRARILRGLAAVDRIPAGIDRHAALVSAFIDLSELVQGLIDAEFAIRGEDGPSRPHDEGMALLMELANGVHRSWQSGLCAIEPPSELFCERLRALGGAGRIRARMAEGYAFYALYPESYLLAAMRSGLGPGTRVIGLRSIGTGLAALVAAALGAAPPITLRPVGHPFRREIRIAPALAAELTRDPAASFAIVDEGPGLSGSSFGAVADWLAARGVAREAIHFFPSHRNWPGPEASAEHRERWGRAPRHCVEVDDWLLRSPDEAQRLETWLSDRIGPLDGPLEDISGGGWRRLRFSDETAWPASNIQQERRKFLAHARGDLWLAKFVGLGRDGLRKLETARLIHVAGFGPEAAGLCHGFLVQRWCDGSPLNLGGWSRGRLIETAGAYLGFRASSLPAGDRSGASLADLAHMAAHNAREALGDALAASIAPRLAAGAQLEPRVRRVDTDNRLQPWEWLDASGRLLKVDAVDHSSAHDLVGCQDIAWDIAGVALEFDLSAEERARLRAAVEQACGRSVDPDLLAFMTPCYLAFHLGACTLAARAVGGREGGRLLGAARDYGAKLARWAGQGPTPHGASG